MAKCKFTDARVTDILAILDKDENDNWIICLDDEQFDLEKILESHQGDTMALKFTRDIE